MAAGSQMKPFTEDPSSRATVPMPSGAGIPATNPPNSFCGTAQTSTSIPLPLNAGSRTTPGLAGVVFNE